MRPGLQPLLPGCAGRRVLVDEQPRRSGGAGRMLALLVFVAVVIRFAVWICLAIGVIVLLVLLDRRLNRRAGARDAIAARADEQHARCSPATKPASTASTRNTPNDQRG